MGEDSVVAGVPVLSSELVMTSMSNSDSGVIERYSVVYFPPSILAVLDDALGVQGNPDGRH